MNITSAEKAKRLYEKIDLVDAGRRDLKMCEMNAIMDRSRGDMFNLIADGFNLGFIRGQAAEQDKYKKLADSCTTKGKQATVIEMIKRLKDGFQIDTAFRFATLLDTERKGEDITEKGLYKLLMISKLLRSENLEDLRFLYHFLNSMMKSSNGDKGVCANG